MIQRSAHAGDPILQLQTATLLRRGMAHTAVTLPMPGGPATFALGRILLRRLCRLFHAVSAMFHVEQSLHQQLTLDTPCRVPVRIWRFSRFNRQMDTDLRTATRSCDTFLTLSRSSSRQFHVELYPEFRLLSDFGQAESQDGWQLTVELPASCSMTWKVARGYSGRFSPSSS